jgi:antirestriction protein ArdC
MSKRLSTNAHADIYQRVTEAIIRDLEQGARSWIKPWTTSSTDGSTVRPLRHDGSAYRGINVLILWSAAERGYPPRSGSGQLSSCR